MTGRTATGSAAARQWADALAEWAVPDEIRAAAPESPHGFSVAQFSRIVDEAVCEETPSENVTREVLPQGGIVLDVGCGGGAGAMPLAPLAEHLIGVDESEDMLEAFAERAAVRGVTSETVTGRWPDVADDVPAADVGVCHNVLYNVADIEPFVHALTDHARLRVVVELTQDHPVSRLAPYWRYFHDLERPTRPTADDAVAAIREAGYDVGVARWERSVGIGQTVDERVAFARKRLCLSEDRDDEIRQMFEHYPPPQSRPAVTLWWAPAGHR